MVINEDKYDVGRPTETDLEEQEVEVVPTKKSRVKQDKNEKKKKKDKSDKLAKKAERRSKGHKKNGKKVSKSQDKEVYHKPTKRPPPPKGMLETFLDYFENRRRLIVSPENYTALH